MADSNDNDPLLRAVRSARDAWRAAPKGGPKHAALELYQDAQRAYLRAWPRTDFVLIRFIFDLQREDRDGPLFVRTGAR